MSKIITDVPKSWNIHRLKNVCKLRKKTKLPPLTKIANIPMNLIPDDGTYANYVMKSIDNIKSGDICKEGDILLAGITPSFENGKQGIVPSLPTKYAITTTEAFPLICGINVEPHFIFYLLKYEFTRRIIASRMEGSTGRQRVPSDILMNFHVPIPPLVEQRGIVEVLGTVDECIRLTKAVIERADHLKRGLMQQLLTRGIGHTEYKETPIGKIPKTWKISELGKIANIERGKFSHRPRNDPAFYGGTIPFIQTGDIANSNGYIGTFSQTLNEKGLSVSRLFLKGTIVISIAANIGDVGVITFDSCFPDSIVGVTPKNEIDHKYLLYLLRNYKERMNRESIISTQKNINLKILNSMKIPIPSFEEQKMISKILYESDEKTNNEIKRRNKLKNIKQGLMQILLSGKIRVELKGDELHRIRDGREAHH